jgi:hypothetical protein
MVFSNFGAPLYEGFESNNNAGNNATTIAGNNNNNNGNNNNNRNNNNRNNNNNNNGNNRNNNGGDNRNNNNNNNGNNRYNNDGDNRNNNDGDNRNNNEGDNEDGDNEGDIIITISYKNDKKHTFDYVLPADSIKDCEDSDDESNNNNNKNNTKQITVSGKVFDIEFIKLDEETGNLKVTVTNKEYEIHGCAVILNPQDTNNFKDTYDTLNQQQQDNFLSKLKIVKYSVNGDEEADEDEDNDVANNGEANNGEADDDEEDNSEDDEDEDNEPFVGNRIEGFNGSGRGNRNTIAHNFNMKLLLKSLLFACLFYLLAHGDTRTTLLKLLKIDKAHYLYLGTSLFFVIYLILNILI